MFINLILVFHLFMSTALLGPSDAELTVNITDIKELKGKVAIQLLDIKGDVVEEKWIEVKSEKLIFKVTGLESGDYAVKFFHDVNNNGIMDKNWMGIPTESFGFSNNPKIITGIPDLKEMLFKVSGNTAIDIRSRSLSF